MGRAALTPAIPARSIASPVGDRPELAKGIKDFSVWCRCSERPHRKLFLLNVLHGPFLMFLPLGYIYRHGYLDIQTKLDYPMNMTHGI